MSRHRSSKRSHPHAAATEPASHADGELRGAPEATLSKEPFNPAVAALCGLALVAAMLWAYWPTLAEVVAAWWSEPDYSHGFLVAPLAIAFLYVRRASCPVEQARPSLMGLTLLGGVAAVRLLTGRYFLLPVDAWTIPIWIAGCVWLVFGLPVLRWSLPSIIFLWFMFPMPYSAEHWLSVPLQSIATKVSTFMLLMLGQPAISEGNTIWLGDHPLNVEEACSGLRIFMSIFALAFAFVLFSRWDWWQKVLALVAALPVAIIANATRIVLTGLLTEFVSTEAAAKFSHDFAGVVMIPFAALLFWLFYVYMERLYPEVELVSPVSRMAAAPDR